MDELIVVDTGSHDRSAEIASQFGARVFHFKWCDDFSAARNFSIDQATGQWILVLDADEEISAWDHPRIRELIRKDGIYGYELVQRNYLHDLRLNGAVPCDGEYPEESGFKGFLPVPVIRLFRNDPRIRFQMPVHELVLYSMKEHGLPWVPINIPIHHFGYATEGNSPKKLAFYKSLGGKKLLKAPSNFMAYYELGVNRVSAGKYNEAIELLRKSVNLKPDFHQSRMMLGTALMNIGNFDEAVPQLEKAIELCPSDFGALNNLGTILRIKGCLKEARSCFEKALAVSPENSIILHNLGLVFRDQWNFEQAKQIFQKALEYSPNSLESLLELAIIMAKKGERKKAIQYVRRALKLDPANKKAKHLSKILAHKPVTVSLCMIVRDEEENLRDLLPTVKNIFDEIVIVDTGSTDNTKLVALEHGARVFDFPWCDDFSVARNFSIAKATGDYVLWLDADDRLSPENKNRLLALKWKLLEQKTPISLLFTIRSSFGPEVGESIFQQLRLFPRLDGICFEGRIHEQLFPSLHKMNIPIKNVDITIDHIGYQDEKKRVEKVRRDLSILEKEKPGVFTFLHKANLLESLGDIKGARYNLEMALAHEEELIAYTGWYEKAVIDLTRLLVKGGEIEQAKRLLANGLQHKPDSFLLLVRMGELLYQNEPATALSFLQKAASISLEPSPVPLRINEEKSRLHFFLGECHCALNHLEKALSAYAKSLQLLPHNPRTWSSLESLARSFEMDGDFHLAVKALELLPTPRTLKDQTSLMCLALKTGNKDLFARHAELLMEQLGLDTDLEINSLKELSCLLLSIAESLPNTPDRNQLIEIIYDTLQTIRPHISISEPNPVSNPPKTIQVMNP